jgi:hypothetical protein
MVNRDAYDVFISYARSDQAAAAELNGWLCAQGFSTFFDRSALRPGLPWVPALEEAIGRSKAVAILVGPHGIGNTQQYERELALIRQTADPSFPVIPVLTPGCDSPPTGFLQLVTWVDLSKGRTVREQTDGLEALSAALSGETVASAVRASICPYRGLEPFREEDAAFFCGRDDAIHELVARVKEHGFVAVVGPSGSGKSSLVFAGLVPALRKQGKTTMWDVVTLRPGKSPLTALAEAFGTVPANAGAFENDAWLEKEAEFLRAGDAEMLTRAVDRRLDAAPEKPDRLLIYVDQWEELYAMAGVEDKARLAQHSADVERFIELLIVAASSAGSRASVVITVRADFYNPLIRNPLLAALLPKQQVNMAPMSRNDLRAAIEMPAKTAGMSFAPPQLVDRILDDVGLDEGRLPLLQFALKETWERRESGSLTAEAYTAVGGVAGAIEKTAQGAYERLTPAQQEAARRLFLRLVTPGEGQEDTRARSVMPDDPQQRDVINLFANPKTRLLVTGFAGAQSAGQAASDARATVEVAHEALIQRWPTLRAWVNASRENLRSRAAILRFKAEWEENAKKDEFLLDPGVQLERARSLLQDPGDVPVDDVSDYVNRSIEKDQRRIEAEREASVEAQKRIADAERQAKEAAEEALRSEANRRRQAVATECGQDFHQRGWGVIFGQDSQSKTQPPLRILLEHRQKDAGSKYLELTYRPGESATRLLARYGADSGPLDPIPYYLLIVASPEEIPYSVQYELASNRAVGRLFFEEPQQYTAYADNIVRNHLFGPATAVLFGPVFMGDSATKLAQRGLLEPIKNSFDEERESWTPFEWSMETVIGGAATKSQFTNIVSREKPPALLFIVSHGMSFTNNHPRQKSNQGAVVCADWPGFGTIKDEQIFSCSDVGDGIKLGGTIIFANSAFSAGTPKFDDFVMDWSVPVLQQISNQDMMSPLPMQLLGIEKHGALAFIGHVDRNWAFSIQSSKREGDDYRAPGLFSGVLRRLMNGYTVGLAMDEFRRRYALEVTKLLAGLPSKSTRESQQSVYALLATLDARNYVIIGDPAVSTPAHLVESHRYAPGAI